MELPDLHAATTKPPSNPDVTARAPMPSTGAGFEPSVEPNKGSQNPSLSAGATLIPSTEDEASKRPRDKGDEEPYKSKRREMKQLYVHLNRVTVKQQKAIATAFGIAHVGDKKIRAARIYVVLGGIMERGGNGAEDILKEKGLEKRKDFFSAFRRTIEMWCDDDEETEVPDLSELERLGGVHRHSRTRPQPDSCPPGTDGSCRAGAGAGAGAPMTREHFTLEEFARLMLIFRDVPEAAADLRRSVQNLTREQLGLHTSRSGFWDNRIEPVFNDSRNVFAEQFDGELRDINPGRPVTTFRTGACLQNVFNNFQKEFIIAYNNWSVSGNLEPSNFIDFCYIPKTTVLSKAGLRCLLAFRIFRLGTPHKNTLILEFGIKEMAGGANAQLESGLVQNRDTAVGFKRRRSSSNELNTALAKVSQAISNEARSTNYTRADRKRREELDSLAVEGAKLEINRKRIDLIVTTTRYMREIDPEALPDPRILGIVRRYCERLADEMEDVLGNDSNARSE